MRIWVYVKDNSESVSLQPWAADLRKEGHRVHFALDKPFRKAEVCDAYRYDGENMDIVSTYEAANIPMLADDMLGKDIEKRTPVNMPEAKPEAAPVIAPTAAPKAKPVKKTKAEVKKADDE